MHVSHRDMDNSSSGEAEGEKGVRPTNVHTYLSKVSCSKFFQQFELISRKVHRNLRVLICNIKQNKRVVVVLSFMYTACQ